MPSDPPPSKLLYFTATPDHITPLGSSVLKWDTVLATGASLSLDGHPVQSAGSNVVAPAVTTTYGLSVTQPRTSPEPQVSGLVADPPTPLGYATVYVDASQCVQQTQKDVQEQIQLALADGYDIGVNHSGSETGFPAVSITTGLITFDMKGTAKKVVTANVEMKGSFGLTVDRAADQLAPVIESNHVTVSVSAAVWAAAVAAGAVLVGAAGAAIGGVLGGIFGAVIGAVAGAIGGGIAAGVTLNSLINNATSSVEQNIPALLQGVAHHIGTFFSEPPGMAFTQVSIAPDPTSTIKDGNITVMFCPKPSPLTNGGGSIS